MMFLKISRLNGPLQKKKPIKIYTPEPRVWGERRPKDRVTLQIVLVFMLTHPQNIYMGAV
jgi:hypothetical protein